MPPAVDAAIREAVRVLRGRWGARVCEVRVFGSVARGDAGPDSDVDLLVVMDRLEPSTERLDVLSAVTRVGIDHGLLLEAHVYAAAEVERLHRLETALAAAWARDGVVVS